MDVTFWCSSRHLCHPRMWCDDHLHEPWSKLYIVRQGHADYGISRDGSEPVLRILELNRVHLIPGGCRHRHACAAPFLLDWCHFTVEDHDLGLRLARLDQPASWPLAEVLPADLEERAVRCAHHTPGDRLIAAGLVLQLLGRLPEPATGGDSDLRRRLAPAVWWLDYHFRETVSVAALARKVGLKPSRFQQLFHQLRGCGVYAYVMNLRLAEAQRLLATNDAPVQEVAAKVGYANPFHFTRIFGRHFGQSPSAWRAQAQARIGGDQGDRATVTPMPATTT